MEKSELRKIQAKDSRVVGPFVAMIIGAVVLIATFFMPFATATDWHKENLMEYADETFFEGMEMTNGDVINVSLFEYARVYGTAASMGIEQEESIVCLVIICIVAFFAAMVTLFSLLKKPVAVMIFNIMTLMSFFLVKWDFKDRGIITGYTYKWGMAQIFLYLAVVLVMVGAIAMLVGRSNVKAEVIYREQKEKERLEMKKQEMEKQEEVQS